MSLRHKLLLWYTGVLAVSGFALMFALYLFTAHQMHAEVDKFLSDECEEMISIVLAEGQADAGKLGETSAVVGKRGRYFELAFRIYDPVKQEDVFFQGNPAWQHQLREQTAFFDPRLEKPYTSMKVGRHGHHLRVLTRRLTPNQRGSLVIQGCIYVRRLEVRLVRLRIFLLLSVVIGVGLAYAGGRFLAARSLQPMSDIVTELNHIEAARLAGRLDLPKARDEVLTLRVAINSMLQRLEDAFKRMRGFTADAAHELRTPIASLRCQLEVALAKARSEEEYRETLAEALAETDLVGKTIDNLLLLARMDAQALRPEMTSVSLKELLVELEEVFSVNAEAKGQRLSLQCESDCILRGNKTLLRKLFGNLIENAIRYTPAEGSISLEAIDHGDRLCVRVSDTGMGISPEMQAKVFERFVRVDESRSLESGGVGLGLSICRSIVELHGGTLSVQSQPGQGSTFEVCLPANRPSDPV